MNKETRKQNLTTHYFGRANRLVLISIPNGISTEEELGNEVPISVRFYNTA